MLELLAFAVLPVALVTSFVVPLMWGQIEQSSQDRAAAAQHEPSTAQPAKTLVGALTAGAALIAASTFMQAADAQQFQRPLPNDPERFRMIEQCVEMTFGRSAGKEHMLYQACIDELERAGFFVAGF